MLMVWSLLAIVGLVATVFSLSMVASWRWVLPLSFALAAGLYGVYPFVAHVNFQRLVDLASFLDLVSLISLYLICEGLVVVWACHVLASRDQVARPGALWPGQVTAARVRRKLADWLGVVVYLPTLSLVVALVVVQSWLFHRVSGVSFQWIALLQVAAVALLLPASALGVRWLLPQRDWRIEMRIMLGMLQIGLAMFLPVLAAGTRAIGNPYAVEPVLTVTVLGGIAVLAAVGLGVWRLNLMTRHPKNLSA